MGARRETARPLLTPGEVMQLPQTDELVLVSGVPPIRAKKARYFADPRLTERVLVPSLTVEQTMAPAPDDWGQLPVVDSGDDEVGFSGNDDSTNGGIRQEPELPQHKDIV